MSIDWVTVIAQLVNFLLLVWLLRRFLYRPILDGIDAREAEIARRLDGAEQAREQARQAEARWLRQHEQIVAEQETRVAMALRATEEERAELLAGARAQMTEEQRAWRQHLAGERADFLGQLQKDSTTIVLELVRKVLHDLADEPLEAAIVRQAARRLAPMAAELSAAAGDTRDALLTTRAALDTATQAVVSAEFARLLPGVQLRFDVDPGQAPGAVVQSGGARVAWTIDSYLDGFDARVAHDGDTALAPAAQTGENRPATGTR